MNISAYLLKRLQNVNNNAQATSDVLQTTQTSQSTASIFENISFENIKNFDFTAALAALTNGEEDLVNAETNQPLSEIVQTLLSDENIQGMADIDGDGSISAEEIQSLVEEIAGLDGDVSNLSQADIDSYIDSLSASLDTTITEEDIEKLVEDTVNEIEKAVEEKMAALEAEEAKKKAETEAATQSSSPSSTGGAGSSGGTGSSSGVSGTNASNSAKKAQKTEPTAAEELEELRQQRQEIIDEADKNIQETQTEKDNLVADSTKISDDLKKEYADEQKAMNEIQTQKKEKETSISDNKASVSSLDADITALEAERDAISNDSDDEEINSQNASRKAEIEKSITSKNEEKEKLEQQIEDDEQALEDLEKKEQEQQKVIDAVEQKIAKADPDLKKKMDELTKEIDSLKTQKDKDVAEIDAKIKIKETEQKEEAKQAGTKKGEAANDIGSGLVELASKYMGLNEGDGSYKLFTNGRAEAWCADFVTYIVNEYANEQGLEVADGFGSPAVANLMSWAQNNGAFDNTSKMSNEEKMNYINNELSVGDIIIWKSNGASHTGIVKSINSDGTFTTIEGNSSDQVKSNAKSITDASLTGFIKLKKVVS